jgi:hypothetical protein
MTRRSRGCLVVIIAIAVAAVALLGVLQGVTNAKPVSRFTCWLQETEHHQFGGRERVWDDNRHECGTDPTTTGERTERPISYPGRIPAGAIRRRDESPPAHGRDAMKERGVRPS